jgi:hypothetical protein
MRHISLLCISAFVLLAQDPYGRITGRVVDSAAAVVPGVNIRVANIETSVVTSTVSDSAGNYEARDLVPGHYTITAETKGFKRYLRGPVEVRVGDVLTIDIAMELGAVTDSVTVTAEAPLIEAASSSLSQIVDKQRLEDLPMPSDAAMYLTQLAPGIVQTTPPSGNWQINQAGNMSNFGTYGTATQTSEYTLNGVPNMRQYGMINFQPMPEILQEFRVESAPFDASEGHFTGSHINMVTKTGTNSLHGSLTYQGNWTPLLAHPFFTDNAINNPATGPVTAAKIDSIFPPTRMNRYRGEVTGPIYLPKLFDGRNRMFFTFGADLFSRVFVPAVESLTVPTPAERTGDFSALLRLGAQYQIYDPATIAPAANGRFSRQPLPGNIVPASRINPVAEQLLAYYPLPNTAGSADGLSNYSGDPVNRPTHHNYIGRIDDVINPNNRLFISVQHGRENTPVQQVAGDNFNSNFAKAPFLGQLNEEPGMAYVVDDVISLRPDLVLDLRAGVNILRVHDAPASRGFNLESLGLPASLVNQLNGSQTAFPQINITDYSPIGPANDGTSAQHNYYYFAGDVAHNRGNHSLRAGAEFRVIQQNTNNVGDVSPNYTFGTAWTQGPLDNSPASPVGQGLASFLLGLPTTGQIDNNASQAQQNKYAALFLQDDWKVSRKLTLNLGLRYDLELPTTERYNRENRGFAFSTPNPIEAAAQANYAKNPIPQIPAVDFQTLGGILFAGVNGVPRGLWSTVAHDFSPRAGLAYQLGSKTVVRAGYGIFFDSLGADSIAGLQQGFSQSTTLTPSLNNGQTFQATLTNPFPSGLLSPAGASGGLQTFLGQAVSVQWPDRRPGYVQRWTFGIQHELPARVMIEVGYVGSRATGLAMTQGLDSTPAQYLSTSPVRNQTVINTLSQQVPNPFYGLPQFAGSALQGQNIALSQLLAPYPEFNGVSTTLSSGFSWYHGLEVRADKRLTHDLSMQASFTWSKDMEAIAKLNPTDAGPSHVISTLDRPLHLVVSGLYELPVGNGKRFLSKSPRVVNEALGGWSIQAIFQGQSGPPIGFGNIIFTGNLADLVLPIDQRTIQRWFNTSAGFNENSSQQLANNIRTFPLRLTGLRANGYNNWDMSVFKGFQLREKMTFQLRAEAQDALNHPMFDAPNTTPTSSLFGQVTATVGAQQRVVTVGARLMW